MIDITDKYTELLPIQYFKKIKAKSLVEFLESEGNLILNLAQSVQGAFDINTAVGKQLDIIGDRVGLNRAMLNAELNNLGEPDATDNQYRFLLRFKIGDNNIRVPISSFDGGDFLGLQEAISFIADNQAFVVDTFSMSLCIDFQNTLNFNNVLLALNLNLLPTPQAIKYSSLTYGYAQGYYGYSEDPYAEGFNDVGFYYGGYIADEIK
jgi:hypothetical protein